MSGYNPALHGIKPMINQSDLPPVLARGVLVHLVLADSPHVPALVHEVRENETIEALVHGRGTWHAAHDETDKALLTWHWPEAQS